MPEHKAVRLRRSRVIHAVDVESMRIAVCGLAVDGATHDANEVPTCKRCLRKLAGL